MCGIFGVIIRENAQFSSQFIRDIVKTLFLLSESRGKEASGLIERTDKSIIVLKAPLPASELIKSRQFSNLFTSSITEKSGDGKVPEIPRAFFGHSRLVTNGRSELNSNNQPVIKNGSVGIHNGVIANDEKLWKEFPHIEKNSDVDTEILLGILQFHRNQGSSIINAVKKTYQKLEGSASIAVLFDDTDTALLATNTGSLYTKVSLNGDMLIFASEQFILKQLLDKTSIKNHFDRTSVTHVRAGTGFLITLSNLKIQEFDLGPDLIRDEPPIAGNNTVRLNISDISSQQKIPVTDETKYRLTDETKKEMLEIWELLYSDKTPIKRCTKCLMPDTMPFVTFDDEGVCNYCREYERRGSILKGEDALEKIVSRYRRNSGETDVLLGFSGGRDSSYGLQYITKKLNLHPLTFIYDWGMVTDLARRNQARVCGKLGIEQIIVSADIKRKRENIRKNLEAWLKKPDLGMVPILMAGDKEFYHYFHKIRKQNNIQLFIFCGGYEGEEASGLFKLGFCGVNRNEAEALSKMTGISLKNKLKLILYYIKSYLTNPGYINDSIFDTLFAYYSSYILPDDYLYLFEYIPWDENEIVQTIRGEFNWELETDTQATWRTDDGTAAIYNYIYFTMAGFTEFDLFRCQQVREGKLTRDEALEIVKTENQPRFKSIEWYAGVIDLDANHLISTINRAQKKYQFPKGR
ncbi:hypothetical protein [uncultured Methanoregula sp.]|uniref:hypothetical protein n=1 Tax=uncultured Methanoregula sp. TaxID=1005933 RepID=UPI002AAC4649|nr:hypothetical protein [uncultured Methanoregula sp.]